MARHAAEDALAATEREQYRFLREELPEMLEQAKRCAVEEYTSSDEFRALLSAE